MTATMTTRELVRLVTKRRTCAHANLRTVQLPQIDALLVVCDACQRRSEYISREQAVQLRIPLSRLVGW